MNLITTDKLTKIYAETTALDNISLTVASGQTIALLGPNGAGKTTLIHILLGILSPSSGSASVFGMNPMTQRHFIAKKLNFSSAFVQLPSNLKVSENMKIFAGLYEVKNPSKKINELLETFEIAHLKNRTTGALSSGEKTRLNLCKCLLNNPELLLLDEPTASLDPEMADTVRTTLKKIQTQSGLGILYTSHNMPEVEKICDEIFFIHQGKLIARGTPEDIKKKFESESLDEVFIKVVRNK